MKTKLLLTGLLTLALNANAQVQPTLINAALLEQAKSSGSDCSCAAWINKDLGSQGENSGDSKAADGDAIKFDNLESDLMYQEVAVEANSSYTFTFNYRYSEGSSDTPSDPFVSPTFNVAVLKGSGYDPAYTISYQDANDTSTFRTTGYGYSNIANVETATNQLISGTYTDPGDSDYVSVSLTFDTGAETSVALVLYATGNTGSYTDGSFTYNWFSGDSEVRTGAVSLVNNGATLSLDSVFSSKFQVTPNPTSSDFKVISDETIDGIGIYDMLGKQVNATVNGNSVDVSSLAQGIYFVKVTSGNNVAVKKIMKK